MSKKQSFTVTVLAVINAAIIVGGIGLLVFYALWAIVVLAHLALFGDHLRAALPAVGIIGGAALIWGIVRWLNRRDDPHHAKLPPDPP